MLLRKKDIHINKTKLIHWAAGCNDESCTPILYFQNILPNKTEVNFEDLKLAHGFLRFLVIQRIKSKYGGSITTDTCAIILFENDTPDDNKVGENFVTN